MTPTFLTSNLTIESYCSASTQACVGSTVTSSRDLSVTFTTAISPSGSSISTTSVSTAGITTTSFKNAVTSINPAVGAAVVVSNVGTPAVGVLNPSSASSSSGSQDVNIAMVCIITGLLLCMGCVAMACGMRSTGATGSGEKVVTIHHQADGSMVHMEDGEVKKVENLVQL